MAPWSSLGVLAFAMSAAPFPFAERTFFTQLAEAGQELKIQVFVLDPRTVHLGSRRASGYAWRNGRWRREPIALPALLYDRCYYPNRTAYRRLSPFVAAIKALPHILFLGHGLPHKWAVYRMLRTSPALRPYLPETAPLSSAALLRLWLRRHGSVVVKPRGGAQGRGVLRIQPESGGWRVVGRDGHNRPVARRIASFEALWAHLVPLHRSHSLIVQPYLALHTVDQTPFDLRVLVQKDGTGTWRLTGSAVRAGQPGSLTANLHGGGRALATQPFLEAHYPHQTVARITEHVHTIATVLPSHLEAHHGRLFELGIDLGIEPDGRVWILEVNSKPGRASFWHTGDWKAARLSVLRPLEYARWLLMSSPQTGGRFS
ncbi:YheC/YheD family endospore coat-associated protein [Calditerricola satsumensis]|uniref:Endospore coat-associated protein YheC n=1 Tax=Calditerricola satsumensis TaxID=373054 RepID=A0A8J3F8G8_9BACI|nr:YheC/YheD family protein [Calditerricola satsumensis]GGJ92853.1 endospore coat-associated protein YheC [Calditerricola satsumensis]